MASVDQKAARPPIEVICVRKIEPEEDEGVLLKDWTLTEFDKTGFKIKLSFHEPILISSGDEADVVLVQLNLSDFEDKDGLSLPDCVLKAKEIPRQTMS